VICVGVLSVVFLLSTRVASPATAQQLPQTSRARQGTDVRRAIGDAFRLLLIEHGSRIAFQAKTRRELGGPFWSDYRRSVRLPGQWADTDSPWVNYLGHPIHGAAAGLIWLDHGEHEAVRINRSRSYWASRARSAA